MIMKKFVKIITLCLVLVFTLSLVACGSSYAKLEKAFTKEGYTVSENFSSITNTIKGELEKEELPVELHVLEKEENTSGTFSRQYVVIIEFKTTDDLVNACKESATLKGIVTDASKSEDLKAIYNTLVEKGWANGNCLVYAVNPLGRSEVKKIVKAA